VVQESQSPAPDWESLGVAGALLSRYEKDQQTLIEQLATFLESTLPRQTSIHRTFGIVGPRRTAGLTVELGGMRYELKHAKTLEASRTRVVRGVAVRTEALPVETWIMEVSDALAAELERAGTGRTALQRLLQG
jgi:hypothetical protein